MRSVVIKIFSGVAILSAMLVVCSAHKAVAQNTTTFAQTTDLSGQDFTFNGTSGTFTGGGQTLVSLLAPNGYGAVPSFVLADYSLTGTGVLVGSPSAGVIDITSLNATFTAKTPVNGDTNLLSFTDSGLSAMNLGGGSGSTALSSNSSNLVFSSDFLSFANVQLEDLGLGLSSVNATSPDSFTASEVFTFASDVLPTVVTPPPAVPEPSGALVIGLMIGGIGVVLLGRQALASKLQAA